MASKNSSNRFKCIVIGCPAVGKSSIIKQLKSESFMPVYTQSHMCDYFDKTLIVNKQQVILKVWDTMGQTSFLTITKSIFHGSAAAMLVYDVTNRTSFNQIIQWLGYVKEQIEPDANVVIMLIGNKCDLESNRQVKIEEGLKFAREHDLLFMEASAQKRINIEEAFCKVAEELLNRHQNGSLKLNSVTDSIRLKDDYSDSRRKNFFQKIC